MRQQLFVLVPNEDYMHPTHTLLSTGKSNTPAPSLRLTDVNVIAQTHRTYEVSLRDACNDSGGGDDDEDDYEKLFKLPVNTTRSSCIISQPQWFTFTQDVPVPYDSN
jgi:hypothetical protein